MRNPLTLCLWLWLSHGAFGEQGLEDSRFKIGLGLSLERSYRIVKTGDVAQGSYPAYATDTGPLYSFSVPVIIHTFLRVEPRIGFYYMFDVPYNQPDVYIARSSYRTQFVMGIFYNKHKENYAIYYGGKLGVDWNRIDFESKNSPEALANPDQYSDYNVMDIIAGPSLGAEYYFSACFSLGGELSVHFLQHDPRKFSQNEQLRRITYGSTSTLKLRFYL